MNSEKRKNGSGNEGGIRVVLADRDYALEIPRDVGVRIAYTRRFFEENGLFPWIAEFKMGTAGYRDTINMDDFFSTDAPFNAHTVLIIAEATARIYTRRGYSSIHMGGEVRRYTPQVLEILSRVFAHHGIAVHLHADRETTPIWASSFGVFFNELDGGINVTASHSQSFKQGMKPMDGRGMQLIETADDIRDGVRAIGAEAEAGTFAVTLAPATSPLIKKDFHYLASYAAYLEEILPGEALSLIRKAQGEGMRVGVSTVGGSMHENSLPIFNHFGILEEPEGMIRYLHKEKRDDFHGVGLIGGEDYGSDPTRDMIYRNIGLKELLLSGEIHAGFIWDPDGDRYNIVTLAESSLASKAAENGLEVEEIQGSANCVVYFKPNQIYFLITARRLDMMARSGELFDYDFLIGTTYPTSRSIGELAGVFNSRYARKFGEKGTRVRVYQTPVGFKYFGRMVEDIEEQVQRGGEVSLENVRGERVGLGGRPRILIMAEESGGAALGSGSWCVSATGKRRSLAMKEKDGMQLSLMNLGIMAGLFLEGRSYASLYLETIETYDIRFRHYQRVDKKLFDESLTGEAREGAKTLGNKAKAYMVENFRDLTRCSTPEAAGERLQALVGGRASIPRIHHCFWAGDGTYIDFGDFWFELRASGTDAVLRFYIEGRERGLIEEVNRAFVDVAESKIRELARNGDA